MLVLLTILDCSGIKWMINLNQMLLKVYCKFRRKASENNLSFLYKTSYNDEAAFFRTDRDRLTQVVQYLGENAAIFTKEGAIKFGYEGKGEETEF
jgi:signal transduction histidine kinase